MEMKVTGAREAAKRMQERAARTRDLRPILKIVGEEFVTATKINIDRSRSLEGEAFAPLADSTRDARARRGNKARRGKRLTAAQKRKRTRAFFGKMVPLRDTSRLYNSLNVRVRPASLVYSAVQYLFIHASGTGDIPKRNPTVFAVSGAGRVTGLKPSAAARFRTAVARYIATGERQSVALR